MRAVALAVSVCGTASCRAAQAREPEEVVPELVIADAPLLRALRPTIPFSPRARINLDAVWWTTPRAESLERLADRWGTSEKELLALNPELTDQRVEAGRRVTVYRFAAGTVSRSIGAPNHGRIENSAPFPQGEGWVLRGFRPRSYATRQTVRELAASLTEWRERYPQASPVKLGELSKRGGGRVRPHKSHRTGRDVDIGYVMREPDEGHRFVSVTDSNLDAAATWGLVRRLLASGAVQSIFMARSIQQQLIPHAARTMDDAELRATFSVLETDARARKKTTIKAWRGHDDHMHVRFACTEADLRCSNAVPRKKKKRRKRGGKNSKKRKHSNKRKR